MKREKALTLCGVFAISNMGQPYPSAAKVARYVKRVPATARDSAVAFGEQYMETNADENAFAREAGSWFRMLYKMSDEDLARQHPTLAKLYDDAVKLHGEVS